MGLLNKLGIGTGAGASRNVSRQTSPANASGHSGANQRGSGTPPAAVGPHRAPAAAPETNRVSNGLKEFLWNLDGLGRGNLLDLGPAWQTTLNFFIERGFRVTSEDILRGWVDFLAQQAPVKKESLTADDYAERTPEALANKFLKENLQYGPGSFDALLLWDILDYTEPTLGKLMVNHVTEMLRPGGVVLALF